MPALTTKSLATCAATSLLFLGITFLSLTSTSLQHTEPQHSFRRRHLNTRQEPRGHFLSPSRGDVWYAGQQRNISWESSDLPTSALLSLHNPLQGDSVWNQTLPPQSLVLEYYTWTVTGDCVASLACYFTLDYTLAGADSAPSIRSPAFTVSSSQAPAAAPTPTQSPGPNAGNGGFTENPTAKPNAGNGGFTENPTAKPGTSRSTAAAIGVTVGGIALLVILIIIAFRIWAKVKVKRIKKMQESGQDGSGAAAGAGAGAPRASDTQEAALLPNERV